MDTKSELLDPKKEKSPTCFNFEIFNHDPPTWHEILKPSFFTKTGQKLVFLHKNKVKKNYETSKKCNRVSQKSETTEKRWNSVKSFKKKRFRPGNVYITNYLNATKPTFGIIFQCF